MTDQPPVRAGLIGCGSISSSHLKTYKTCGIELAALCDRDISRAEAQRDQFGAPETPIFDDHRELLQLPDIDFVTVATPVAAHVPITVDALRAGKHVACEKPSALTVQENQQVVREARLAGKKVIFFSSRMRWGMATMAREYINNGELGEIYRVDVQYWRRRGRPGIDIIPDAHWFLDMERAGGGVIMDMGQYFMDLVMDLVGWPDITSVYGATFRGHDYDLPADVRFDVEEHCTFLAHTDGPLTFSFDMAWIAHHEAKNCISILGTEGGIRLGGGEPFTFYQDKGAPWRWVDTTSSWKDRVGGGEHAYREFIQAVRGDDTGVGTTPEQALKLTALTQMAFLSAAENRVVTPADLGAL